MIVFFPFLAVLLALFCYSYGYLDFNLTLSNHPLFLKFVGYFQHLVFFDRPLSTNVYLALVCFLWFSYFLVLLFKRGAKTLPIYTIVGLGLVAALSYPLFTHDIFNYLFHARVVVTHHANPHVLAPQTFAGDEWLRFMHWVHNPSAYGYAFTAYMIIPYVLGLTKLTLSLYLYKLLSLGWYLLAVWLVGQIAKEGKTIRPVLAQLLFALNPLIILEWLVNAHNENLMVTLMLLSWYLLGRQKKLLSFLALLYGALSKYAAVLIAPALLTRRFIGERRALILASLILAVVPFLYHYPTQYQVWYITWVIPFAILTGSTSLIALVLGYSLGGFLTYIPYISTGFWILSPATRELYFLIPASLFFLASTVYKRIRKI